MTEDSKPPVLDSAWGPVTEKMRLQAARNMKSDSTIRDRVLAKIVAECGGDEARGKAEFARRYPEAVA